MTAPIDHVAARRLAAEALDFPLAPAARASLDAHLAGCARCRRSARDLAADATLLAGLPPHDPPARLEPAALRLVREARSAPRLVPGGVLAFALAGALALGALAAVRLDGSLPQAPAANPAAALSGAAPPAPAGGAADQPPAIAWRDGSAPTPVPGAAAIRSLAIGPDASFVAAGQVCAASTDPSSCTGAMWASPDGQAWTGPQPVFTAMSGGSAGPLAVWGSRLVVAVGPPRATGLGGPAILVELDASGHEVALGKTPFELASLSAGPGSLGAGVGSLSAVSASLQPPDALRAWSSRDGGAWTAAAALVRGRPAGPDGTSPGTKDVLLDLASGDAGLVALGTSCSEAGCHLLAWLSKDGATWVTGGPSPGAPGRPVAVTAGGSTYVAVGSTDAGGPAIWRSVNGLDWRPAAVPGAGSVVDVAWTGAAFVAVGVAADGSPLAWTSIDGARWLARPAPAGLADPVAVAARGDSLLVAGRTRTTGAPAVALGRLGS